MNLLREYIRELLTERSGMRVAEDLPDGIVVTVEDFGKTAEIYYDSTSEPGSTDIYPFGRITINAPWPEGDCDGAWNVTRADADSGWGPMLYDIAIEWATQNANGLMADRSSVEQEAENVWNFYLKNRKDVTAHQVGDENCDQDIVGDDLENSPLSKRYTKDPVLKNKILDLEKEILKRKSQ